MTNKNIWKANEELVINEDAWKSNQEKALRLRGTIINCYAQIEFLLGDLIIRCRDFIEYGPAKNAFTHSASKRVNRMRSILECSGSLDPFREQISEVLDRFEQEHETRNVLVHGYCEFIFDSTGSGFFRFQKWHYEEGKDDAILTRVFLGYQLEEQYDKSVNMADDAIKLFVSIHNHFGWVGRFKF